MIQTQQIAAIPGSAEPMKPVKVKTVQVKAGSMKLASAGPSQPAPPITNTIPARPEIAETSSAVVARAAETNRAEVPGSRCRRSPPITAPDKACSASCPPPASPPAAQPAASKTSPGASQALAYADPAPAAQPQPCSRTARSSRLLRPTAHSGWIIQVGALESEGEAKQRIDLARSKASSLLSKADPFTEPVVAKDNRTLFRARFAGLERDQAEAVCKTLKRADISCITVRN